ncbi:MAG: hypothetical protein ACPGOY_04705 [Rhodospirillaceae bacterium]
MSDQVELIALVPGLYQNGRVLERGAAFSVSADVASLLLARGQAALFETTAPEESATQAKE